MYYEGILPLLDTYTEACQGKYGIFKKFTTFPISSSSSTTNIIEYFRKLLNSLNSFKIKDTYLKNIYESIVELIYRTLYLLNQR